jgi:hypothetical protein
VQLNTFLYIPQAVLFQPAMAAGLVTFEELPEEECNVCHERGRMVYTDQFFGWFPRDASHKEPSPEESERIINEILACEGCVIPDGFAVAFECPCGHVQPVTAPPPLEIMRLLPRSYAKWQATNRLQAYADRQTTQWKKDRRQKKDWTTLSNFFCMPPWVADQEERDSRAPTRSTGGMCV